METIDERKNKLIERLKRDNSNCSYNYLLSLIEKWEKTWGTEVVEKMIERGYRL